MIWYQIVIRYDTISVAIGEAGVLANKSPRSAHGIANWKRILPCQFYQESRAFGRRVPEGCNAAPPPNVVRWGRVSRICIYPLLIRSIQSTSQHLTGHRWPKCLLCAVCGPGQLPWLVVCAGQRGRTQNTPPWPEMWKVTRVQISIPNGHYIFVESGTTAPTFLGENYLELV